MNANNRMRTLTISQSDIGEKTTKTRHTRTTYRKYSIKITQHEWIKINRVGNRGAKINNT